jgi:two-component system, LytTR family, sensor kinase
MQLRIEVLKSQLQPHFLFNTLNAISVMMYEDVKGADRMIQRLSALLRVSIAILGKDEVPLATELAFVSTYLEIERVRFGERLSACMETDPNALNALVPALFLQPIVENCVRHGLAGKPQDGLIVIAARVCADRLILEVLDNGGGLPKSPLLQEGVGLGNSRKRLQQLYPRNHLFTVAPNTPCGVIVRADIPFHCQ